MPGRIANGRLASKGRLSHEWASRRMSVIEKIKAKSERGANQLISTLYVQKTTTKWKGRFTACRKK